MSQLFFFSLFTVLLTVERVVHILVEDVEAVLEVVPARVVAVVVELVEIVLEHVLAVVLVPPMQEVLILFFKSL